MHVRLGLHTALYVLSVSLVMAAAINPAWTNRVLRRQVSRITAIVRTVPAVVSGTPVPSSSPAKPEGLIGSAAPARAVER